MRQDLQDLIREAYRQWKDGQHGHKGEHPDEEEFTAFVTGSLGPGESAGIREHIVECLRCAEILSLSLGEARQDLSVPEEVLEKARELVCPEDKSLCLEVFLRLKEGLLELINTTGDVLVGQEFLSAPVLRTRSIKDFKDEVRILKDIKDVRVEVKVEAQQAKTFNLIVAVKEKPTQKVLKDLRVSLVREGTELESYINDSGTVVFEHVALGNYRIEISKVGEKVATVNINIKS
jgi:hypothetical protein